MQDSGDPEKQSKGQRLEKFLTSILITPISRIFKTERWLESE